MPDNSDAKELEAYGDLDIFGDLFEYLILEGIGVLFTLAAFIIIIISSIKLIRGNSVPGARLIIVSIIFTLIFALISASYAIVLDIKESTTIEAIMNIVLGILFFVGAIGFLHLSKFAVSASANKTPQPTPISGAAEL